MIIILLSKEVEIYVNVSNQEYLQSLGYSAKKIRDKVTVKVEHLKPYSRAIVKIKCDFCGDIFERTYNKYYPRKNEYIDLDCCNQCKRKKMLLTCKEKYGNEYHISTDEVRKKIKKTMNDRYGVDNPTQVEEFIKKSIDSRYKHGNNICSSQQYSLYESIGGELNFPFNKSYIDIAFPDEKIAVEYIGGGHNLSVKLGKITQSEFDRNENFRRKQLFLEEWCIIEFISLKNKILDTETNNNIIEFCKNLIENHNKHYIKVYIDEGKIVSGNNKICYKMTLNDWNEKTPC